jgi:hypothetical protein
MIRRWALNRSDLILGALSLAFLTIMVIFLLAGHNFKIDVLPNDPETRKGFQAAILAAWGTVALACIGGAVKITAARQSLISLFSSEIKAIQYGLVCMDMFDFWRKVFDEPDKGTVGFADVPREEKYFEIFHTVSRNIGNLHPQAVEAIVRFYTYLKMSRDAAAALKSWKEEPDLEVRRLHVRYVVRLLSLSMLWGFIALWFMGLRAKGQERELLDQLESAYNAVMEPGRFTALWVDHIGREALEGFFARSQSPS